MKYENDRRLENNEQEQEGEHKCSMVEEKKSKYEKSTLLKFTKATSHIVLH